MHGAEQEALGRKNCQPIDAEKWIGYGSVEVSTLPIDPECAAHANRVSSSKGVAICTLQRTQCRQ